MRHTAYGGSPRSLSGTLTTLSGTTLPGSTTDYRVEAGSLWLNSAVAICLDRISTAMELSVLRLEIRRGNGDWQPVEREQQMHLLLQPNPHYNLSTLLRATVLALKCDGNAFWLLARTGGGVPAELWWEAPWRMRPLYPSDGSVYLSGWERTLDGRKEIWRTEDVIHFRQGIDPTNERLGLAPLAALIREIVSDNQATAYTAALLKNSGVPGVLISPAGADAILTPDAQERLAKQWGARAGGDNRGRPIVMTAPMKIEFLSWSPEQLALDKLRGVPEDRVCAALQVPAMVAGLTSGAQHKTYANYGEALRDFWENGIIPLESAIAAQMTQQLLPDLGLSDRYRLAWDYSKVPALQADLQALMLRAVTGYEKGILTRAEARELLGYETGEGDAVYYTEPGAAQIEEEPDADAALDGTVRA
jgi:HK97 family phage portal protein